MPLRVERSAGKFANKESTVSLIRRILKVAAVALLGLAVVGCCIPPYAGHYGGGYHGGGGHYRR